MIITPDDAYTVARDDGFLESFMTEHDRLLTNEEDREYIRKKTALLITPWLETSERGAFLEIGCGHGTYASFFVHLTSQYIGYDIYRPSLEQAEAHLKGHAHCTLVHGDGRTLKEFGDGAMDFVFSYQTLVHVPTTEVIKGYIREACRVLSPHGVARLHMLGPNFQHGPHLGWLPLCALALGGGGGGFYPFL